MFTIITILLLARQCFALTGLQKAVAYIREPIDYHNPPSDIVLHGYIDRISIDAYKLQILRMRIGLAWELVMTDYGFQRGTVPTLDLVSRTRKIAIELKNNFRINSQVKRANLQALKEFKRRHPTYQVILGFVNYKSANGKVARRGNVDLIYGNPFLQHIFNGQQGNIIRQLRRAVRTHFPTG